MELVEPDLEASLDYPVTSGLRAHLLEVLSEQHLLLLTGEGNVCRRAIARHVAAHLERSPPQGLAGAGGKVPVREWAPWSGGNLPELVRSTTTPTLFMVPDVHPFQAGHALERLQDLAAQGGHYLVLAAEAPPEAWELPSPPPPWCPTWSARETFSHDRLEELLIRELGERAPAGGGGTAALAGHPALGLLARQLYTPENVLVFADLLAARPGEATEEGIRDLARRVSSGRDLLRAWLHSHLGPRERLLALGLSLFSGLLDDQMFGALEVLVQRAWKQREPALCSPDYADLRALRAFFVSEPTRARGERILGRLPDQRRQVFEAFWDSHRRQLLGALPVLVEMARTTVGAPGESWELYGDASRREQLRGVIGDTLGDLARVSLPAVRDTLLHLAADPHPEVQGVVARALARWRQQAQPPARAACAGPASGAPGRTAVQSARSWGGLFAKSSSITTNPDPQTPETMPARGADEPLADLLESWCQDPALLGTLEAILARSGSPRGEGPRAYLLATVALAVGRAALHDPPGRLSGRLEGLLARLAEEPSALVRGRLYFHTLPLLLPAHISQLRPLLCHLAEVSTSPGETTLALARALERAYRSRPLETQGILEEWYKEGMPGRGKRTAEDRPGRREILLAAVALTYAEVRREDLAAALAARGEPARTIGSTPLFRHLKRMLEEERHPFVRGAVLAGLSKLAQRGPDDLEEPLQMLLAEVSDDERRRVVEQLTEAYLEQRARQEGGDAVLSVHGRSYRVWLETPRPPTAIEQTLHRWVKDARYPAAQRVALDTLLRCALVLDQPEEGFRIEERERRRRLAQTWQTSFETEDPGASSSPAARRRARRGFYVDTLVPWLATFGAWRYRAVVQELLAEALAQREAEGQEDIVPFVLNRWQTGGDGDLQRISRLLERALRLVRLRRRVRGATYFLGLVLAGGLLGYLLLRLGLWPG